MTDNNKLIMTTSQTNSSANRTGDTETTPNKPLMCHKKKKKKKKKKNNNNNNNNQVIHPGLIKEGVLKGVAI